MHKHRETALGVKADVDGLLSGFGSVEGSVSELEDKLQDSKDLINNLNNHLTKAGNKDASNSGWHSCLQAVLSVKAFVFCRLKIR